MVLSRKKFLCAKKLNKIAAGPAVWVDLLAPAILTIQGGTRVGLLSRYISLPIPPPHP